MSARSWSIDRRRWAPPGLRSGADRRRRRRRHCPVIALGGAGIPASAGGAVARPCVGGGYRQFLSLYRARVAGIKSFPPAKGIDVRLDSRATTGAPFAAGTDASEARRSLARAFRVYAGGSHLNYCIRCLYPENHPLGITFDEQGICSGCRVHEEKYNLDWEPSAASAGSDLPAISQQDRKTFDCIVPVTGARDSYFIVDSVKRDYGMNPLLVSYNRHYNTERGIRNLAYLRTGFDCDYLQQVSRRSQSNASFAKPSTARQFSLARDRRPNRMAGPGRRETQDSFDRVGPPPGARPGRHVFTYRRSRNDAEIPDGTRSDGIGGRRPRRRCRWPSGIRSHSLDYPHDLELSNVGVRGIYLGNFFPWDTKRSTSACMRSTTRNGRAAAHIRHL